MLGGKLKDYSIGQNKESLFLSEFVKLFPLKDKEFGNFEGLLQGYVQETKKAEDLESPYMTPLSLFEKLNNERMRNYFNGIISSFDIEVKVQKCGFGHLPEFAEYHQYDINVPIIIPNVDLSIEDNKKHHILRYNTVKDQVECYFNQESFELEKCHYKNCNERRLKSSICRVPKLPTEGFIVKSCKDWLLEKDNMYLALGDGEIELQDGKGISSFAPVSGIREEFGYYIVYIKKKNIWWKFTNAMPEIVQEKELGYCEYIFYVNSSLNLDASLSESSE